MRRAPNPPSAIPAPSADQEVSWTGKITLLTPLYKGGANPEKADKNMPFRGPSIRGQLRFWWRATSELTDVEQLRAAERELFGGVFGEKGDNNQKRAVASKVRVGVLAQRSETIAKAMAKDGKEELEYLLWTCRNPLDQTFHKAGATGQLYISGPCSPEGRKKELQKALVAFLLCGGLGSRSRRGLGSVWLESEDLPVPKAGFQSEKQLLDTLHALVPAGGKRAWPTLAGARLLVGRPASDPGTALARMAAAMQAVRTYKNKGRPAVFQQTWLSVMRGQGADLGYTAALGLPIQYQTSSNHFPGKRMLKVQVGQGRPKADRYPSPILFRTIKMEGGKFLPVMVVLQTPTPKQVALGGQALAPNTVGNFQSKGLEAFIQALPEADWKIHTLGATP